MTKTMYRNNLHRVLTLFLALLLSLSAITVSGSAASYEVLPDGSYIIYTESLVTCLNVQYKAKDGGKVVTDTAGLDATAGTTLEDNEIWVLKNVGGGYVTLSPKHAPGYYLSGQNGFDKQLVIRKCVPNLAVYQWLPIDVGNGAFVFKNRATNYVIDVCNGWNDQAGTTVLQYHQNGFSAAQSFYPVRISHFTALAPSNRVNSLASSPYKVGLYYAKNQAWNSQYNLASGANLVVDPYNGQPNEQIYIQNEGNGLYSLRFASNTNLCIAPPNVFVDSQLKVKYYDGTASCLYEIYKVGSTYSFRNKATGLFIDDFCCQTATGTKIISYSYNGCDAQRFYLTGIIKPTSTSNSSSKVTMSSVLYGISSNSSKLTCGFDGYVSLRQQYGYRHEGIDFQYKYNTPGRAVHSLTDGVVTNVSEGSSSRCSTVAIYYAAQNKTVVYLHLDPSISKGATVSRGTVIGTEASRGTSSVHTHVEVRDGYRTAAAVSSNTVLENSDPTSFWNSLGYTVK